MAADSSESFSLCLTYLILPMLFPSRQSIPVHISIEVDPERGESRSSAARGRGLPSCLSPQTPVGPKEGLWREWSAEPRSYARACLPQHLPAFLGVITVLPP